MIVKHKHFLRYLVFAIGALVVLIILFSSIPQRDRGQSNSPLTTSTSTPTTSFSSKQTLSANNQSDDSLAPTSALVPSTAANPTEAPSEFLDVIKVVDGDTIAVNLNGRSETLRLIGIDTPETVDPRKPVQCFGQEASKKAKETLTGKKVRIEADLSQGERDKYNRLLRYVFLEDGTHFNYLMISEGYAFEYTYNVPYKYQTEFQQAENQARENQRGLWADDTCAGEVESSATTSVPDVPTPTQPAINNQLNDPPTPTQPPESDQQNEPPVPTSTPAPPTSTPIPQPVNSECDCSGNVYNCPHFSTHAEAQACFDLCGGIDNDVHRLDQDGDGLACESLP